MLTLTVDPEVSGTPLTLNEPDMSTSPALGAVPDGVPTNIAPPKHPFPAVAETQLVGMLLPTTGLPFSTLVLPAPSIMRRLSREKFPNEVVLRKSCVPCAVAKSCAAEAKIDAEVF